MNTNAPPGPNGQAEADIRQIEAWVRADEFTMDLLRATREFAPLTSFVAAGSIRNLVWDRLHGFDRRSPLHDIDVVYHNQADRSEAAEREAEARLLQAFPGVIWQVRNQARMHERNGEAPYRDVASAMKRWPETATAIGVRLTARNDFEWVHPWGLRDLLELKLKPSPLCANPAIFARRVRDKQWLCLWPLLSVEPNDICR